MAFHVDLAGLHGVRVVVQNRFADQLIQNRIVSLLCGGQFILHRFLLGGQVIILFGGLGRLLRGCVRRIGGGFGVGNGGIRRLLCLGGHRVGQEADREDDAGDRGLRTSKLQYLPCKLAEKFCFDVKNELEDLDEIPTLKTERLTLSAFTDKDREAYNALCLDDERNKWWGYDYRADWKGEDLDSYFLDVVQEDFAKKRAINFAIRLDGKCIGEVLLYRFDGKGGAEEGCRIAPEYGGMEAFRAVLDGLHRIEAGQSVNDELLDTIRMITTIMNGMQEEFAYDR